MSKQDKADEKNQQGGICFIYNEADFKVQRRIATSFELFAHCFF
jgi:hypothetical protein